MLRKKTISVLLQNNPVIFFIFGIILGAYAGRLNRHIFLSSKSCRDFSITDSMHKITNIPNNISTLQQGFLINEEIHTDENLVLIGVMTAKEYLNTRALAALKTWVQMAPGRVIFFSSEGSELIAPEGLEIVGLKGVDDSYPPQKKSFAMLKYMHDNYINDYRFFLRADDDVYIRGNLLAEFLHSIDDNYGQTPLFIGQAGLGSKHEAEPLYLHPDDNFCMGGTTIIINKATLTKLAPNIPYCLANVFTNHEDVELGRCIARHVGVSCTWAYEMQKLLYNNYREPKGSFTHSLNDPIIANAITLHPIKNPKKKKVPTATLR